MISFRIVKNKGPIGRRVPGRYIDTMTLPPGTQGVPIKEEVAKTEVTKSESIKIEIPKIEPIIVETKQEIKQDIKQEVKQEAKQKEVLVPLREKDVDDPTLREETVDLSTPGVLPPPPSPQTNRVVKSLPCDVDKFLVGINTHDYDGILKQRVALFPIITKKRPDAFIEIVYENLLKLCEHPKLRSMFQDFMSKNGSNFDPTNGVDASLILSCIYEKYMKENEEGKKDIISSLKIQLDEMSSGFCAQGRTTRLLQVLFPLLEK